MMYKVKIEKLDHFARGMAKINGKIIFVPKTLPGDVVSVEIVSDKKKYFDGQVVKYINKVERVGECPYSDKCGGCPLIDLEYQKQLTFKQEKIQDLLKRNLGLDIEIEWIEGSHPYHYRNKVTLHVIDGKIGYYEEESKSLVAIEKCVIAKKEINEIIGKLNDMVSSYDIKEVIIKSHDAILLSIIGNISKESTLNIFNNCDVIYLNKKLIKGKGYVSDRVLDREFRISLNSFFQINTEVFTNIFNQVISYINNKNYNKVLDLYCGTGIISIVIANYVKEVVGIEIVEEAVEDANYNKEINKVNNVSFICDKVENRISEFRNIDLVIVDPPRSGLDKKSINSILQINPQDIIYISCNPSTLVRDLKTLMTNYEVKRFFIADMFPNTYHVECCCILGVK